MRSVHYLEQPGKSLIVQWIFTAGTDWITGECRELRKLIPTAAITFYFNPKIHFSHPLSCTWVASARDRATLRERVYHRKKS